jgi:hypothetical protein
MVKICQTGLLKLYFETLKKTHFPVFAKNFHRPWLKLKIFFCQFPNPWALRVSGMGGYTSKCEKSQNHCTLLHTAQSLKSAWDTTFTSQFCHEIFIQMKQVIKYGKKIKEWHFKSCFFSVGHLAAKV